MQANIGIRAATDPFREPTLNWFKIGETLKDKPLDGEYLPSRRSRWLPILALSFGLGMAIAAIFIAG